ncbi:phage tail protein [Kosakonia sacchari]|uniref:phage tail protein n=1 Tax=Kosakonia sacchari TaxID=1158459 RepID=UPI002ACE24D3|nr:phage tail protein [Kosakonia sacchari]MDZ7322944.1 phage tail protein [Kosakonia sacchari]
MENKLPDIALPVWMNKGEPLTLAHASKTWWERVHDWLTFPLAQIDVDTCDEQLLTLLAYQRDVERFPGESLSLFRLRVKYAFANAQDAGSLAGFSRIFERLGIGEIQQLERQLQYDWDVILIRINDEQLSRDNTLMMQLVRQYGRTCRRYFFDVINSETVTVRPGWFELDTGYYSAGWFAPEPEPEPGRRAVLVTERRKWLVTERGNLLVVEKETDG